MENNKKVLMYDIATKYIESVNQYVPDNISIIGGADGPTSVFVAGKLGMNWLSTFGLVLVILLLIPNTYFSHQT